MDSCGWAAVSRAIRSPTPFDRDVVEKVGPNVFLIGNPRFAAEFVTAFKMGDRGAIRALFDFSLWCLDDLRRICAQSSFRRGMRRRYLWGNVMDGHVMALKSGALAHRWMARRCGFEFAAGCAFSAL